MIEIPPRKGMKEPLIRLFENKTELQEQTSQTIWHGYYKADENLIVATPQSVAHEIGHFRDYASGRMPNILEIKDKDQRIAARLRNEMVAILFARTKTASYEAFEVYEMDFLGWFEFMRAKVPFAHLKMKRIEDWQLSDLQDYCDWAIKPSHEWHAKLRHIFKEYLKSESVDTTYSQAV